MLGFSYMVSCWALTKNGRSFRCGRLREQIEKINHARLGSSVVRVAIHG